MDFEEAKAIAEADLRAHEDPGIPLALTGDTMERSWCFVFFYNSRECVETGDPLRGLAGNGPIVVNKNNSEVWTTGSAKPTGFYLDEYAQKHGYPVE